MLVVSVAEEPDGGVGGSRISQVLVSHHNLLLFAFLGVWNGILVPGIRKFLSPTPIIICSCLLLVAWEPDGGAGGPGKSPLLFLLL